MPKVPAINQAPTPNITPANTLVIGNEIYNATIAPGESVSFGMEMVGTEFAPVAPISVNLTNVVLGEVSTEDEGIPSEETVEEVVSTDEEAAPVVLVEDDNDLFPYAIFAESDISFNGWKSTVTGDIYSGGNYLYQGSELYMDGIIYANAVTTVISTVIALLLCRSWSRTSQAAV